MGKIIGDDGVIDMRCVYLMEILGENARQKFGIAGDVIKRRQQMQVGCPHKIHIVCQTAPLGVHLARLLEKSLIHEYRRFRVTGEWFDLPMGDMVDIVMKFKGEL